MQRRLEPEWLDQLPAQDPLAARSRRDLRRLNGWMGNARTVTRALHSALGGRAPASLVEIGAGDGDFLLRVARRLVPRGNATTAVLVDRQDIVSAETRHGFIALGWRVTTAPTDVFDWFGQRTSPPSDAIIANLFLHHFTERQLALLFAAMAGTTRVCVACEPRRSGFALMCSRLISWIGGNAVTCHDAVVSVRAGFAGRELSSLWPDASRWVLTEARAGLFSHLFVAQRREG